MHAAASTGESSRLTSLGESSRLTLRDKQREQTRRRVRECALVVFRRDGIAAARIDDIVRAARVSRGTFYFHFPTKEDVIDEVLSESEHRIATAICGLPGGTRLEKVLAFTCEKIAEEWEGEARLFTEVGAVAVRRAAASFREGHRDPVSQALADEFRAAVSRKELTDFLPAEILADFFLVNAFAATLSWCAHPKTPLRRVFSSVIGIFLEGARGQRRPAPARGIKAAKDTKATRAKHGAIAEAARQGSRAKLVRNARPVRRLAKARRSNDRR